jgi:anti-sigma B factor antagonist
MAPPLQIVERRTGDVSILDLKGRIVLGEGDAPLRDAVEQLLGQGRAKIVLNLHDVTYIDSAGIGVMVGRLLTVRRKGGDIKLMHLTARSHRVMTITKLLTVFDAFVDEAQAVASFDPVV